MNLSDRKRWDAMGQFSPADLFRMRSNWPLEILPSPRVTMPCLVVVGQITTKYGMVTPEGGSVSRGQLPVFPVIGSVPQYFGTPTGLVVYIAVMWSETVGLRTRPVWDQKIGLSLGLASCGLGLVVGLAVLELCCETRSCNACRHKSRRYTATF